MLIKKLSPQGNINLPRRRFVTGVAAGSALIGLGISPAVVAETRIKQQSKILRGRQFDLTYSPIPVNFTGKNRFATAINGSVPAPTLRWKEGEEVTLNVTNHLAEDTSIHWHGIILPSSQDGVPNISEGFSGIKPSETFQYKFRVNQSGTYWYHSHSGFQEPTGAYGAIIIDPIEPEPFSYDRDYVVTLSDWSDEKPDNIYAKLKKLSHYYNYQERTVFDALSEVGEKGWDGFWSSRGMWNEMRMSDRDISDVTGYTYTYLMNGQTPEDNWTGIFKRGEKIRLRFINAAAMSFFDISIPGLKMTVVAADGQYVQPFSIDEFRLGVAETYDVIVEPSAEQAYSIFAQSIDRTGFSSGTLTPNAAMKAIPPAMDVSPILGHGDMGMSMAGMDHGNMAGMDHSKMAGMDHSKMDHSGHDMSNMTPKPEYGSGKAGFGSNRPVIHKSTEFGPHVDMRADSPEYRIDDPGIGLRNNGRKVLTYADLRNLHKTPDPREPGREIDLHLTGNMSRYMWSMNGIKFADAEPLKFKFGERLRINFINDTMMNHPMHLHGMWSDLETGDPDYIPRKHTVIVQPGSKASYLVTADAMGGWAFHCHLFFHMLGMFRKVEVS
ncbi:copper resistance system multicopper oxidase [Cycloclasticus pugetii]|uniref:copper resistance system multicopper oxidase n=1 Tax=Cycloclasticus pugetii TaxID=34068 RepID=UPI003A902CE5